METQNENKVVDLPEEVEQTEEEKSDDEKIAGFLLEYGSPQVKERMSTPEGKKLCVSFIRANLAEANGKVEVAAGWLQQSFD